MNPEQYVMKHPVALRLAGATFLAVACSAAGADVITEWNFNSVPADASTATGSLLPTIGAGSLATVGGVTGFNPATFASGNGSSDPASSDDSGWQTTNYAAQGTGDRSRGVQFNVSTVGYTNIGFEFDQRHSNTSSRFVQVQYSTDGVVFNDLAGFEATLGGDTWYNDRSVSLSGLAGVDNNANFAIRIVAMFAPSTSAYAPSRPEPASTYGAAGTWRFDMVQVTGSPVPVPAALPLLLSGLGFIAVRRRRA
jgi:hypothetical protein